MPRPEEMRRRKAAKKRAAAKKEATQKKAVVGQQVKGRAQQSKTPMPAKPKAKKVTPAKKASGSFDSAFASARKAGKSTFSWNGKSYTTKMKSDAKPKPKADTAAPAKKKRAPIGGATKLTPEQKRRYAADAAYYKQSPSEKRAGKAERLAAADKRAAEMKKAKPKKKKTQTRRGMR